MVAEQRIVHAPTSMAISPLDAGSLTCNGTKAGCLSPLCSVNCLNYMKFFIRTTFDLLFFHRMHSTLFEN